jgi:hypothetical protein
MNSDTDTTRSGDAEGGGGVSSPPLLALEIRREIFTFYRQIVQRHLYFYSHCYPTISGKGAFDDGIVFLSKNPAFTMRLESLYREFPDASVVCMVRDPVDSVSSMISYITMVQFYFTARFNFYDLILFCFLSYPIIC